MIVFANGDPMHALYGGFAHFVGDPMVTITGQAVDTGAHQEMRAGRLCFAEELVNVILPVANVNQSLWLAQQGGRLAHIFEPAIASFSSIGTRLRIPTMPPTHSDLIAATVPI
jgi:hypothetical protein